MLKAIRKGWLYSDFTVMEGAQPVADIYELSWWRYKELLTVEGTTYKVQRERLMSRVLILESAGSVLARAWKPGAFSLSFIIEHAGKQYKLREGSTFRRQFLPLLLDGHREIGSVSLGRLFARRARADLPEHLPLPVRIFIIWLAFILRDRCS